MDRNHAQREPQSAADASFSPYADRLGVQPLDLVARWTEKHAQREPQSAADASFSPYADRLGMQPLELVARLAHQVRRFWGVASSIRLKQPQT